MRDGRSLAARIAASIAVDETVSWQGAERLARSAAEHELLKQLQSIEQLGRRARSTLGSVGYRQPLWPWRMLLAIAAAQVILAATVSLPRLGGGERLLWVQFLLLAAFALAALVLRVGGDRRAHHLAGVYLLAAAAYARPLLAGAAEFWPMIAFAARGPFCEALLPYALWRFSRDFPHTQRFTRMDRVAGRMLVLSGWIGAALFAWAWRAAWLAAPPDVEWLAWLWNLRREGVSAGFWNVVFALAAPALFASIARLHASDISERRRALWFVAAIAAGLIPLLTIGVLRYLVAVPGPVALTAVLAGPLSIPFTTAYVILVHRVLPVRIVVRRAASIAITKKALAVVAVSPLVVLAIQIALDPDTSLNELARGSPARFTLGMWLAVAAGLCLLRGSARRLGIAGTSDATASAAADAIGRARTAREAAYEAALQLESRLGGSNVLIVRVTPDGRSEMLYGSAPELPSPSALLSLLAESPVVRVDANDALFGLLPPDDQEWLLAARVGILARIPTPDRVVAGVLASGALLDGLRAPGREDDHLRAVASTLGLALNTLGRERSPGLDDPGSVQGAECERCGSVLPTITHCQCGGQMRPSRLPPRLAGKFEVERRIGQGGMGVVYFARDSRLGRPVALKTLPRLSEGAVSQMYEEARAMAAVDHPNLALIYGLEIWEDTPILVVEYLPGGTLSDRLLRGPVSPQAAIDTGLAIAGAAEMLHGRGVLHRDIKPSNVGFTKNGVAKLLDFGVARFREGDRRAAVVPVNGLASTINTAVAGTPLYLPPEALRGAAPDTLVDLWGIALVMLEGILGRHPYRDLDALNRIRRGEAVLSTRIRQSLPATLSQLFERMLAQDPARRIQSAAQLVVELRLVRQSLTDSPIERKEQDV